jgi:uncharacterized iron-regulated membrane protein
LLRLHRWTTLLFSIPLGVLIVTGLILSFEPIAIDSGATPITADTMAAALAKHDRTARRARWWCEPMPARCRLAALSAAT